MSAVVDFLVNKFLTTPTILIGLLILLGYGIKLLTFMLLRIYFKPYKDYFHISW